MFSNMHISYIGGLKDHPRYLTLSIYFSGCDADPKCLKCHNPELHNPNNGIQMTPDELASVVIKQLERFRFPVVAFVGGEPLAPYNREGVKLVSKLIHEHFPGIKTILYTWRMPEDLIKENLLDYIKYIYEFVLGRYDYTKHVNGFPSSTNQLYMDKRRVDEYVNCVSKGKRRKNSDG